MEEQKILLWGDLFLQKTEKAQESFSRCKDLLFSLQEQNAELEGAWQGQAEAVFCRKTDECLQRAQALVEKGWRTRELLQESAAELSRVEQRCMQLVAEQ